MKAVDSKVINFTSVLKNYMQIVPQFFAIFANLNHIQHQIVLLSADEEFKINLVNQLSWLQKKILKWIWKQSQRSMLEWKQLKTILMKNYTELSRLFALRNRKKKNSRC